MTDVIVRVVDGSPARTEVRSFDTTTPGLLALSAFLGEARCSHVVMDATGVYWKPVWHVLSDGEFTLVLANALHVKTGPGHKTDVADAAWLADLLAHGLVRASFVPEEPTQELRALLRTRKQLVRAGQPRAAGPEDAGGCQPQARFRAHRRHGGERPRHRGRRARSRQTARPGAPGRLFNGDHADLFLYHCSSAAGLLKEVPELTNLPLPENLEVHPTYGAAVLSEDAAAERFALFVLSAKGQEVLERFGFEPLTAAP